MVGAVGGFLAVSSDFGGVVAAVFARFWPAEGLEVALIGLLATAAEAWAACFNKSATEGMRLAEMSLRI